MLGRTLGCWLLTAAAACTSMAWATPAALPAEVRAALNAAQVPRDAMVAVVQEVDAKSPRLAWHPDRQVNPASLMKLFTTFAALDLLGPAWTWTTPVWLQGKLGNGVLEGNLVIKGGGDPKLVIERLWLLLRRVQQLGVRDIRGDIVLDRTAFVLPPQDPANFDGEPLRPYNVRADALLLNYRSLMLTFTPDPQRGVASIGVDVPLAGVRVEASVALSAGACNDWRAGLRAEFADPERITFNGSYPSTCGERQWPMAYSDPGSFNARALAGMWRDMGGTLSGVVRDGSAPNTAPSFEFVSPPLADVVRDINKFSNNVMAQQLFLTLGLTQRGAGTPDAARTALQDWLRSRLGSLSTNLTLDNGSGLSRRTRVSARLLERLLQAAWASPVMPELLSSLPVIGGDGAPVRAHLKTGSLRDVSAVAGYVLADSGRRYVVVGIVNHANANAARPALDALAQWAVDDAPPARRNARRY